MADPPSSKHKVLKTSEVEGMASSTLNRKAIGKKLRQIKDFEDKLRKGTTLNADQMAKIALKEHLESLMAAGKPLVDNKSAGTKRKFAGDGSGEEAATEKTERRKKKRKKRPEDSEAILADEDTKEKDTTSMTIIIGGLPYATTDEKLSRMFGKCGEISKLNVPRDKETGLARGFSFITFKTQEGVEAGLQYDGKKFSDRTLTARLASSKASGKKGSDAGVTGDSKDERSLFFGGLPHNITEESMRKYLSDAGDIETLRLPLNTTGQSKGYAFVCFGDTRSAEKALKLDGCDYDGHSIVVRLSGERRDPAGAGKGQGKDKGSGKGPVDLTVFVQGLSRSTTEEKLRGAFSKCGEMTHVKMPMWDEGESRGFAFISYKDRPSVDKALKLDNTNKSLSYLDCFMSVKMAVDHDVAVSMRDKREDAPAKASTPKLPRKIDPRKLPKEAAPDPTENPRETGALVKSTGKRVQFESDSDG